MESSQQKTELGSANVIVFGDHGSGKRTLINSLLTTFGQSNDLMTSESAPFRDPKKRSEHLYVFDYHYLRVSRFDDDDKSELGKVNFYALNEKYPVR